MRMRSVSRWAAALPGDVWPWRVQSHGAPQSAFPRPLAEIGEFAAEEKVFVEKPQHIERFGSDQDRGARYVRGLQQAGLVRGVCVAAGTQVASDIPAAGILDRVTASVHFPKAGTYNSEVRVLRQAVEQGLYICFADFRVIVEQENGVSRACSKMCRKATLFPPAKPRLSVLAGTVAPGIAPIRRFPSCEALSTSQMEGFKRIWQTLRAQRMRRPVRISV